MLTNQLSCLLIYSEGETFKWSSRNKNRMNMLFEAVSWIFVTKNFALLKYSLRIEFLFCERSKLISKKCDNCQYIDIILFTELFYKKQIETTCKYFLYRIVLLFAVILFRIFPVHYSYSYWKPHELIEPHVNSNVILLCLNVHSVFYRQSIMCFELSMSKYCPILNILHFYFY